MNKKLINWWNGAIVSSYDSDYQAVLDKGTALGATLPSTAQRTKQNTLMIDLKSAGLWALTDVIRVYATDGNSAFALINWKAPNSYLGTISGSLTFTSNVGFTAGGGTNYIDDNYNPSTNGVKWTTNKASIGYWKASSQGVSTPSGHIQSADGTTLLQIFRATASTGYYKINNVGVSASSVGKSNGTGLMVSTFDINNNNHDIEVWALGSKLEGSNVAGPVITNANMRNAYFGNDQSSFLFYGDDCRSVIAASQTAISTYISSL